MNFKTCQDCGKRSIDDRCRRCRLKDVELCTKCQRPLSIKNKELHQTEHPGACPNANGHFPRKRPNAPRKPEYAFHAATPYSWNKKALGGRFK